MQGFPFGPFAQFAQFYDADMMDDDNDYESFQPQGPIDNKELYDILEIEPQSEIGKVKQAYKTLAKKYHPDRPGGNQQRFQLIQKAHEVLSDPEKKKIYDKFGKQALLKSINQKNGFKKCEPFKMEYKITLKDVAIGAYHKEIAKDILKTCEDCNGQGGTKSTTCLGCKGQKIVQMATQIQPGMNMIQQVPCPECRGKGKIFDQKDECKSCNGKGNKINEVEIEIPIEKGVTDGYCVKLYGKGNQKQGYETGDIYVYLQIQQHPLFLRKGTDLFYQKTISLKEALTGTQFQIETLDSGIINIGTNRVIKPNQILTLKEKGLPTFKDELHFGDLHIQFYIEFPQELDNNIQQQLTQLLPGPNIIHNDNAYQLQEFQIEEHEKHLKVHEEEEDDDELHFKNECSIF